MICNRRPGGTKGNLALGPTGLLRFLYDGVKSFGLCFERTDQLTLSNYMSESKMQPYVYKSGCKSLLWPNGVSNIQLKQTCDGHKVFVCHIKYASVSALKIPIVVRVLKAFCGCGLIRLN